MDSRSVLDRLQSLLISAGEIVSHYAGLPATEREVSYKGRGMSPVTAADLEVDEFLRQNLLKITPGALWVSEENLEGQDWNRRREAKKLWIVDPLDGTREFVEGIPEYAISIALVEQQKVIWAGVFNPASGQGGVSALGKSFFWGFKKDLPEHVSEERIVVSRNEMKRGSLSPYQKIWQLHAIGSVAYKLLLVAQGLERATLSVQPKNEWDIAGGVGLLQATGKSYLRADGNEQLFNQESMRIRCETIAAESPDRAQEILRNLKGNR